MDENRERKEQGEGQTPGAGHETRDVRFRPIVSFLVALGVLIVASLLLMLGLFNHLEGLEVARDHPPSPLADPEARPPEPRLLPDPHQELEEVLSRARKRLRGYHWVDRDAGVVQIPIERAMELLVERGLPTRETADATDSNSGFAQE
ncbi:MAG: hypothetical protein ACE5JX_01575 [Acidobacteriota bacterium]